MESALVGAGSDPIRTAWQHMITALDLGPEPAVRVCPKCGATGMRAATRCGYCWSALAPVA